MYTTEQQAIIDHQNGHAMVSAVAGSGKTHTMIGRVKHLLDSGVMPRHILVVMFNKDAQLGFSARLKGQGCQVLPPIRTFHAMAYKMLQRLQALQKVENFKLETENYVLHGLCRAALEEHDRDANSEEVQALCEIITHVKAAFVGKDRYFGDSSCDELKLFQTFEKLRREARLRFFDDLQYDLIKALHEDQSLVRLFENRLDYIIVDEYQDVNPCQQEIIKLLAGNRAQVMVVGDVNQCIYEFRGSDPSIMLKGFGEDFKDVSQYALSKTFRFGQKVCDAANHLIAHNKLRFDTNTIPAQDKETRIHLIGKGDYQIDKIISTCLSTHCEQYSNIAILVREFAHAVETEIGLLSAEIPYQLTGGKGFFETDVVRSMLGFLRLHDSATMLCSKSLEERTQSIEAMVKCPSLYLPPKQVSTIIKQLANSPSAIEILSQFASSQGKASKSRMLEKRADIWDYALSIDSSDSAYLILKDLYYQLGYKRYFEFAFSKPEDQDRKLALAKALLNFVEQLDMDVGGTLTHIDTLTQNARLLDNQDSITITSIHKAKGLEFDCVIMPELIKGKFPSDRHDNVESERRIFYVGMTRAKKTLYLIGDDDKDKVQSHWHSNKKRIPKTASSSKFLYEAKADVTAEPAKTKQTDNTSVRDTKIAAAG